MNPTNTPEVVQTGVLDLVIQAGPMVQFVLLLLLLASVLCWGVIFSKMKSLRLALRQNSLFLDTFWNSKSLEDIFEKTDQYKSSPIASIFRSGFRELQKLSSVERTGAGAQEVDNITRALNRATNAEVSGMERYVSYLATTASAAPFVGLFGTVWGIMNSFQKIGATGSANLAVVAPGISEALIATAVGLAAAIPAVVFYNHFAHQIRRVAVEMETFSQDFLNIVQRGLLGSAKGSK